MFFDRILAKKSQKGADGIIMKRKIPLIFYRKSKKLTGWECFLLPQLFYEENEVFWVDK